MFLSEGFQLMFHVRDTPACLYLLVQRKYIHWVINDRNKIPHYPCLIITRAGNQPTVVIILHFVSLNELKSPPAGCMFNSSPLS